MKTLVILNEFQDGLKFLVTEDERFNKFDGIIINLYQDEETTEGKEKQQLQDELTELLYGKSCAEELQFPFAEEKPSSLKDIDYLIIIGFLP